jgi:hypothetical protein
MRLYDGTILMHESAPYDPVKAHEYYIRNRQLRGRRSARGVVSKPIRERSPRYAVRLSTGKTIQLSQNQLREQQVYAAKRVSDIKRRLSELGTKLRQLRADAKKKPTAAERSKAARESRQYREKHKQELSTKAKKARAKKSITRKDRVAALETKINQVKGRLKAAVETQRALSTATRI